METTFEQGWGARPFKEQFPQMTDADAERLDKLNHAIVLLRVNGLLTDSVRKNIREKKMSRLVSDALKAKDTK